MNGTTQKKCTMSPSPVSEYGLESFNERYVAFVGSLEQAQINYFLCIYLIGKVLF